MFGIKKKKYILALDIGTSSTRAVLYNSNQKVLCYNQKEYKLYYPHPGWVEQNADEMWNSIYSCTKELIAENKIDVTEISAIGITNQRETTIIWDEKTGIPIHKAIVWQDSRTYNTCLELRKSKYLKIITNKTGLLPDPYFSSTKIMWLLDKYDADRKRSNNGELLFGTVDTWILWKLTNGKQHCTDYSNASRTMIFDINKQEWSKELLDYFNIPKKILPKVKATSYVYGKTTKELFGEEITIASIIGDQQSALFGQRCFYSGTVKNTYGTGGFMLMNTGNKIVKSNHGLLSTIAWRINGKTTYALEGSVFVSGAVIQWLRDELGIIDSTKQSEFYANKVPDNNGVYFIPAFAGLGAPHWDGEAKGAILGLTRGSNKNHIIRAAIESMAYQTRDVLNAMVVDSNIDLNKIHVDGGASENNLLMQFQADILDTDIFRPTNKETTALGAALLAGLETGFYSNKKVFVDDFEGETFVPIMKNNQRAKLYKGWLNAIAKIKID